MTLQLTDLHAAIAWNSALILALLMAFFIQWKEIKRLQLDPLSSFVVIAIFNTTLIIGARLGALDAAQWQHLFQTGIVLNGSGKTALGGLMLALPVYFILKKSWKLPDSLTDALFMALPLAAALGRLGCVAAGCCFGTMTDGVFAWTYGAGMPAYEWQLKGGFISESATASLPVFPVQIIFTVLNVFLFLFLWSVRKRLKAAGSMALLTIGLILLNRFWIEFFREAATNRGLWGELFLGLKMAQWYCLAAAMMALFFCWKKEHHHQVTEAANKSIPLSTISMTLCLLAGFFLLFKNLLSFDETWLIALSYLPAIGCIAWQLWINWLQLSKPLMSTSFLSLTAIMVTAVSIDSIQPLRKSEHFINIGIGSTNGSYEHVTRDCEENQRETVRMSSTSLDASYQLPFSENITANFGLRGAMGFLDSDDPSSDLNYDFRAWGPYMSMNTKWLGFRTGPLYIRQHRPEMPHYPIMKETNFSGFMRLGFLAKYHVDIGVNDAPALHFYPLPLASLGFFNWGFNDPEGRKNVRLGVTVLGSESYIMVSGRTPIGKSNIVLEGSTYMRNRIMFGLGLRYRWRPKYKEVLLR